MIHSSNQNYTRLLNEIDDFEDSQSQNTSLTVVLFLKEVENIDIRNDGVKYSKSKQTQSIDNNNVEDVEYQNLSNSKPNRNSFIKIIQNKNNIFVLLIIILTLMVIVQLFILIFYRKNNGNQNKSSNKCYTDKCIETSSYVYNKMNRDVDPCDDFYEYSCGNWIKSTLLPRGYDSWGRFSALDYETKMFIKTELEADDAVRKYTDAELKAKAYYKSCVDSDGIIEKLGAEPLLNIADKFVYFDDENNLKINIPLTNFIYTIQADYSCGTLFELKIFDFYSKELLDSDIYIMPLILDFDSGYYLNAEIKENRNALDEMKLIVKNIITLTHGDINNVEGITNNYMDLSTKLAKAMAFSNEYNFVRSLKDLSELAPFLNWTIFVQKYLNRFSSTEIVNENKIITVFSASYFNNLNKLIQNENEENFKLFLYVKLLKHLAQFASKEFRIQLEKVKVTETIGSKLERWQECIERVYDESRLGYAISRIFLRRKDFNKTYGIVSDMLEIIRKSLIVNMKNATWIDPETYELVVQKANYIKPIIGYPEHLMDDEELNQRYENLYISQSDFFNNELRLLQYPIEFNVLSFHKKINITDWLSKPSNVEAYYEPSLNRINFPSAILQHPFFSVDRSKTLNFGGIGFVIGHELSHAFDNKGCKFNKNGSYGEWWSENTIKKYNNTNSCMIEQYSQYKVNGNNVNGVQTLNENIADNGGIKAAYYGYLKWVEENEEESALPLLNLTNKQLFFVSFAQNWCSKATSERNQYLLEIDSHSLDRYRVIGTLSNSKEFSENFNCKIGSKMNPLKKCAVF